MFDFRSRWFDDGRAEFIRGDTRAQIGLRNLRRDVIDIECGIRDMQRGFFRSARNNFRNLRCDCPCRIRRCNHHHHCDPCGGFDGWDGMDGEIGIV